MKVSGLRRTDEFCPCLLSFYIEARSTIQRLLPSSPEEKDNAEQANRRTEEPVSELGGGERTRHARVKMISRPIGIPSHL